MSRSTRGAGSAGDHTSNSAVNDDSSSVGGDSKAHRPSRRHVIIEAAALVFSREGFAEASIQAIASEARMVPTAVYYHFSGKEELFDSALRCALDSISAAAQSAKPNDPSVSASSIGEVVAALWDWCAEHPDLALMLFRHIGGSLTSGARQLAREYEERDLSDALDCSPAAKKPPNRGAVAAEDAVRALRARVAIATTLAVPALCVEDSQPATTSALRAATADVCSRMV